MDKYDEHIAYLLTLTTEDVRKEWDNWKGIFRNTGKTPDTLTGCLTTVRRNEGSMSEAQTPELTARIRADERIPKSVYDILPEHYPIFADWHRKIDAELGRE